MFDARSILESLMKGPQTQSPAQPQSGQPADSTISDILGQLTAGKTAPDGGQAAGLEDLLRNMLGGAQASAPSAAPAQKPAADPGGFNLDNLTRSLTGGQTVEPQAGGPGQSSTQAPNASAPQAQPTGAGDLLDMLGKVLNQATDGAKEGAGKISDASGLNDVLSRISGGRDPKDVMAQLQDFMQKNKLGTGAALGGLGALIFGTRTGRSLAATAAKVGAAALIGGLAYKAYQNYQQGKPLIDGTSQSPAAAPQGSGFDDGSISQEEASRFVRAMVAATAADGRLDDTERQRLLAGLTDSGMDTQAEAFLAKELQNPASIDELTANVTSQDEAIKLYTAARLAIEPDTDAEQTFLAILASRLNLDENLVAHIDAQARGAANA